MIRKFFITFFILIFFVNCSFATDEVFEETKKYFGISDFVKEANIYAKEAFPDLDIGSLVNSGLKGEIDLSFIR